MYADRTKMNYTMSVITELFRIGIALTTLQHLAAEDVVVRGQKIPKGRYRCSSLHLLCNNYKLTMQLRNA